MVYSCLANCLAPRQDLIHIFKGTKEVNLTLTESTTSQFCLLCEGAWSESNAQTQSIPLNGQPKHGMRV